MIVRPAKAAERNVFIGRRWVITSTTDLRLGWALTRWGAIRKVRRWRRLDKRARAGKRYV